MNALTLSNKCLSIILFLTLFAASHYLQAQNPTFEAGKQAYLDKNYRKAMELFRPLADSGHAGAQVSLGAMYDQGHGTEKNTFEAVKWLEKAALQGNAFVQHDLGVRYFMGDGIQKNRNKAIKWWDMAAKNGIAESQYNLGSLYAQGLGLERDPTRAAQWYEKAAQQGHAHAQYNLAVLYVNGRGVNRDGAKAVTLFRQSAESGVSHAQYNLAALLENSGASTDDLNEARHWYQAAADQGIKQAIKRLEALGPATKKTTPVNTKTAAIKITGDSTTINREPWIQKQQPEHYTIQLLGVSNEASIFQFFKTRRLGVDAAYFEATLNGKPFYKVIMGVYPDRSSAISGRAKLPEKLKKAGPMVLRFGDIQPGLK